MNKTNLSHQREKQEEQKQTKVEKNENKNAETDIFSRLKKDAKEEKTIFERLQHSSNANSDNRKMIFHKGSNIRSLKKDLIPDSHPQITKIISAASNNPKNDQVSKLSDLVKSNQKWNHQRKSSDGTQFKVFIRNLDKSATEVDVRREFLKYGVIKSLVLTRGTAELFFSKEEEAKNSLKSDGATILNQQIKVSLYQQQSQKEEAPQKKLIIQQPKILQNSSKIAEVLEDDPKLKEASDVIKKSIFERLSK